MNKNYSHATVRERLQDLMKERKLTQAEMAAKIEVSESTLSCFISGKTDKIGDESIVKMAQIFGVSTDFFLGVVNEPERKNYDISELGLSVKAAKNLYMGRVNTEVVNRLLENPNFAEVTYLVARYLDDELASGFAAQNQMYDTIGELIAGNRQALHDVKALKVPIYQADLTAIEKQFMAAVHDIKGENGNEKVEKSKRLTKEITEKMFMELTKGQDIRKCRVTLKDVLRAVKNTVVSVCGDNKETRGLFKLLGGDVDDEE